MTMINKSLNANNGLPHFSIKALDSAILCANHHDYEVNKIVYRVMCYYIMFSICNNTNKLLYYLLNYIT